MATKKTKTKISVKVRDLKPIKDAKGGLKAGSASGLLGGYNGGG